MAASLRRRSSVSTDKVAVTDYSPFTGRRISDRPIPRLEPVEVAWRMRAPSGRILECRIYQTEFGYEARMGYGENLLASQYAPDIEGARGHAASFHDDAARNTMFSDVPNG